MIKDSHGREVSYMRISVTDRCNLRCFYCRDSDDFKLLRHEEILRYEEILELVRLAVRLDVSKIRFTGGEPLVRRDFTSFLGRIFSEFPDLDLRLTTNGTLLADQVKDLKRFGLKRINISLDTFNQASFHRITGQDLFHDVLLGIERCLEAGIKVKINAVAMKGVNDAEIGEFIRLAAQNPIDVRFIEYMPMGGSKTQNEYYWPAQEILDQAARFAKLTPVETGSLGKKTNGPARMYNISGGKGRFGLISPLSDHFCQTCNRLRITSDGRLRTCLFSDREYRLRPALNHPALGPEAVYKIIRLAGKRKPIGHDLLRIAQGRVLASDKIMSAIGG